MKKLAIALLALTAINCHADGFKIISKQTYHVDSVPKKESTTDKADCYPYAYAVSGATGTTITATGKDNYQITNSTNDHKSYVIDEYMCIDGFGCDLTEYHGQLGPYNSGSGLDPIEYSTVIDKAGSYTDRAIIDISGDAICHVEVTNNVTVK